MTRRTRRAVLGLTGATVAGLAGCLGTRSSGTRTDAEDDTDDGDDTNPTTATTTTGRTPAGLRLEPTAVPSEGPLVVYPSTLQRWLREAASTGETVRGHATAFVQRPDTPLHEFDRIRLVDQSADVDGWYELGGESGIRYEYVATAEEATPPDGVPVTPLSDLSGARHRLAEAAIEEPFSDAARFYPETPLGEWARHEFFGGYYRHEGTVYRGMEMQQTDVAFFSRECWYILDLEPVDGGAGPELRLGALDERTRRAIERLLSARNPRESIEGGNPAPSRQGAQTLHETGYLLSHAAVFSVAVADE